MTPIRFTIFDYAGYPRFWLSRRRSLGLKGNRLQLLLAHFVDGPVDSLRTAIIGPDNVVRELEGQLKLRGDHSINPDSLDVDCFIGVVGADTDEDPRIQDSRGPDDLAGC